MSTSNNISLHINSGESLSFAIDKQLDKELGTNVELNFNEWNSVFGIVKAEQVETNKSQFGADDIDIKNGKQFVVQAGEDYEIKQSTWSKIVDIAKQRFGGKTEAVTENQESAQVEVETNDTTKPEDKVKDILANANIDISNETEEFQKDVVSKYKTMLSVAEKSGQTLDEETIQTRLSNYVKGLKFRNFERESSKSTDSNLQYTGHQKTDENGNVVAFSSVEELTDAYKQFGKEYVESMDQDGDGSINAHEMFYQNLIELYKSNGMTETEAKKKAIDMVDKFKNYNVNNLPKETDELYDTTENELFTQTLGKIGVLDEDKDTKLSSNEAAVYLMSTALMDDNKNTITKNEDVHAELAILSQDMTVEEIMSTFDKTREEAENIVSFRDKFDNNLKTYKDYIFK